LFVSDLPRVLAVKLSPLSGLYVRLHIEAFKIRMLVAGKCGDIVSFSQCIDGAIYGIEEYEMREAW
jgi:hypothetical protein